MKKIICFILATFSLVYLFQTLDKTCKRKKFFDKIKAPLLSACVVGLVASFIYEEKIDSSPIGMNIFPQDVINNLRKQDVFTDLGNF